MNIRSSISRINGAGLCCETLFHMFVTRMKGMDVFVVLNAHDVRVKRSNTAEYTSEEEGRIEYFFPLVFFDT